MYPPFLRFSVLPLVVLALACAADVGGGATTDLGDFPAVGKADAAIVVEVPFEVRPGTVEGVPGESAEFTFRTCGQLSLKVAQETSQRLQLVAESSIYRRKSWRGRTPYLDVPADRTGGQCVEYVVVILNWGTDRAKGTLRVETEPPSDPGATVVFNQPDCDDGCTDKTGGLRAKLVEAIQSARQTIDMAIYGFDDPAMQEALCNAAAAGVTVRVATEETNEDPEDSRSYYPALFGPNGLAGCGIEVIAVRSSGLMHHKFLIIDRGTPEAQLVMGSTNFTVSDLEKNHNHMMFLRGGAELIEAYQAELDQFFRRCATERLDGREGRCAECTPACTEDVSEEGPFAVGSLQVNAYFSPTDDAMRVLRGQVVTRRLAAPDPACSGPDATCGCRTSGASAWSCDYCAQGEDGWGLVGEARERLVLNTYSMTDTCLAIAMVQAKNRGAEVFSVWDFVRAGSGYSRDDYLCANGIETWISNWGGGSAQVRNHTKSVVVDDVVFDGSMNHSASGANQNNENTLVIRDALLADTFVRYTRAEADLLMRSGVQVRAPAQCLCTDLVDNDGDGLADAADSDCDGGSRPASM